MKQMYAIQSNREIFIVVPAYNEAKVIKATISPLITEGYSVVVVDDCSSDNTWEILEILPVTRIRHMVNLGQGAALQTGMEYARRSGAAVVVHFDADGQHDWREIPNLTAPILEGKADVVLGSRFLRPGDTQQVPLAKRFVLRIGRIISGLMTGILLSDTHNGFRALSRKALAVVQLQENGFAHATEILSHLRKANLHYVEVPTSISYTTYSIAKGQPLTNSLNTVIDLLLRKIFP